MHLKNESTGVSPEVLEILSVYMCQMTLMEMKSCPL